MNKSKKPKRSPRRLVNKFSIKHLLSSTPRSRKRRVLSRRRSPRKCLSYNVNSDTGTIEMHTECATEIADRSTCSEQNKQGVMDGALNELYKEAPWMHGLVSAIKKYPSVKLRVLSEASGTSRWLEITRDQCLVEPTLGPMDIVRLLVSASTHVYQLQVLYPVARVVDRYKG